MPKNKVVSVEAAISRIESGMTIAVGGFLSQGDPLTLLRALKASDVRDLILYSICGGVRDRGIVELVNAGKVRKLVASHIGTTPDVVRALHDGKIEVELVPQGTLAEQLRCGGAGLGGFLTRTGIGTAVAEGKQHVDVGGVPHLLEFAIRTDVALVRAHTGDFWGNLRYRGTAANYNPLCAMCADHTIAEVEFLCGIGEIGPESIHTPGIYVDAVVRSDVDYCGEPNCTDT
ncbi:MAG TPA: CoA transferase subunit A [Thermoleophilia bacterium]|nr:CoA transferase subunit A [Thermoleophilia bacterium]